MTHRILLSIALLLPMILEAKTLNIAMKQHMQSFYPIQQSPGDSNFIRNLVVPPIIAINQNQQWTCIICSHLPKLSNQGVEVFEEPDENGFIMVSHWQISRRYQWDDGKPLSGFDVKFTIEHMKKQGHHFPELKITINHKNPRKFSMWMKEARPDFYQTLAISLLPHQKAQLLKAISRNPKQANQQISLSQGLSYGPYRLEQDSKTMTLRENRYYQGLKNDFKSIHITFVNSAKDLFRALKSGAIDMVADGELDYDDIKPLLSDNKIKSQWKLAHSLSPTTDILYFNLRNPYLADQQVRNAIFHSIDRESLLSDIFDNYGSVAPIPPFLGSAYPSRASDYQLLKARRILSSSGWQLIDGERIKNGARLKLDLVYHRTTLKHKIASRIRSNLAASGIIVQLRPMKSVEAVLEQVRKGLYKDMALLSLKVFPDMPLKSLFHSEYIPNSENDYYGWNLGFWNNKRTDRVLDEISQAFDEGERRKLMQRFSQIYQEDLPAVPLLIRPHFGILNTNLVNVHFPGHGYHSSLFSSGWSTLEDDDKGIF
ncbi:ABC transporter substrate-binding protein [Pseudobacteriovorax antillogorgiicola]|uniref:ABC-type transport system, substrate-binding protein n=1 Tax=Pseudobacteriovorax antillogorgiicola TaxID=1513793 RepID=A0A1Y6CC75_9BACT|nr:ABC transporter substrate-binding protein [Pseudobacteriovorax antillogorgiicola]TCS48611.1 ABC-type transport system substrate-binding protein [Pseudobacteriovorax antillogorgiicola]SMF55501.1 ABC-type transport system, substrate-binding protein [Pseudobacteriovorax antillogorgiicola]